MNGEDYDCPSGASRHLPIDGEDYDCPSGASRHLPMNGEDYNWSAGLKKHDSAPVWHAGPAGFTRSSTASRSQSRRTSTTSIVLPDVAPFSHRPLSRE